MTLNRNEPALPAKVDLNRETKEFRPYQIGLDTFETTGFTKLEYLAMELYKNSAVGTEPKLLENCARIALIQANSFFDAIESEANNGS